jgi:hypothetical protein
MPESFKVFSNFASSFRLTKPRDDGAYEEANLSSIVWHCAETGEPRVFPSMWYLPASPLSIEALSKKLSKWLTSFGIAVGEDLAGMMLGVVALLIEDGKDLVSALHEIKACIKTVDTVHYHVLPSLSGDGWIGTLDWQGFIFARLDAQKLVYRCQKAQAPNHEKVVRALDGAPAVKSPIFKRAIVDISELFWRHKTPAIRRHRTDILEPYLQQCALLHIDAMWEALEDAFLFPFSVGYHVMNFQNIRSFPEAQTWTVYPHLGIDGKHSWVGRLDFWVKLRIPKFDQTQRVLDRAATKFRFEDFSKSSLCPLLQAVSRSVVRGVNHLSGQRVDEAFLFQIIAIEQVFSETKNTTDAISKRTALVSQSMLQMDWPKTVRHVSEIYGKRSGLVHDGNSVNQDDLLAVAELAHMVLRCLMRLCLRLESHQPGFQKIWLKRLDYLVAGMEAQKQPTEAELIENGIIDPPKD